MSFFTSSARLTLAACVLALSISAEVQAQDLMLFPPETFGQIVVPQTESLLGDIQLEAQVGAYNNEFVASYGPDSVFARTGRAVGLLQVLTNVGHAPCTAFLVDGNKLVTNNHCVPGILENPKMRARGATFIAAVQFHAGFLRDGFSDGVTTFHVNPVPLETSKELDYTVLQVLGDANAEFGALKLTSAMPLDHTPFWVIGHPMGEAQRISREKCQADSPAVVGNRLHHLCDTLPGNSGSPVIDADSKAVVALHHAGSRAGEKNYAVPMADILAQSKVLVADKPASPVAAPDSSELDAALALSDAILNNDAEARIAMLEDLLRDFPGTRAASRAETKLAEDKAVLARAKAIEEAERARIAAEQEQTADPKEDGPADGKDADEPVPPTGSPFEDFFREYEERLAEPKAEDPKPVELPPAESGYMGLRVQDLTEEMAEALDLAGQQGVLVSDVPEGPSRTAGLKAGDVILSLDGDPFEDTRGMVRIMSDRRPGERIAVRISRGGAEKVLTLVLTKRPEVP
ncbi:trypsin-like peptidase domain-containing protein [Antarctobacter heliothermus]|uniref:Serine protease n=1 Tax=Antarctobacter heliothermus TaxID=74033 RepID=A0A239ANN7_9RHOB|nr:trypsin-like peptidase domain-containing protein [Antarctobacter heliothermus]SNR97159.1 PDZ domain-containing protein [Antarctobacter heliothermus]